MGPSTGPVLSFHHTEDTCEARSAMKIYHESDGLDCRKIPTGTEKKKTRQKEREREGDDYKSGRAR